MSYPSSFGQNDENVAAACHSRRASVASRGDERGGVGPFSSFFFAVSRLPHGVFVRNIAMRNMALSVVGSSVPFRAA